MLISQTLAPLPLSRRRALALCAAASASVLMPVGANAARAPSSGKLRTRAIPHGGEELPDIGLGTAIVFDVGASPQRRMGCTEVVRSLVGGGGSLIDTAPSYGQAEGVVGAILTDTGLRNRVFLATKIERYGAADVAAELHGSLQRLHTDQVDLLQLHNVRDPAQRLDAVRALKRQGLCRYIGITTTRRDDHAAAEAILKREQPDFIEIDYAIDNRDAESRVIPAAAAAVTAVIPGTDKSVHMTGNLGAGRGRLPDAAMRARMVRLVESFS